MTTIKLPAPVLLQGFLKKHSKAVTHKVSTDLGMDAVHIKDIDFHVVDDLVDCDTLVGRKVTERCDLMYSRVHDILKFGYAKSLLEFCHNINKRIRIRCRLI